MSSSPRLYYGWIVLAICFVTIMAGYVCRNTFAVFYPAIVAEFGWTRGNTALIYSINVVTFGLFAPIAGALANRFRPRYVLAAGSALTGIAMCLCSLAISKLQFYLLYGVVAAIGLSAAGWVPIATLLTNWFVRKRALAFGVLGSGFGLSLVAAYATQYVILSMGWRTAYLAIGLLVGIVIPPMCLLFIRTTPRDKGLLPDGMTAAATEQRPEKPADEKWKPEGGVIEWTVGKALRAHQFWLLFLIWVCTMGFAEQIAISQQIYFYLDAGYAPMTAAVLFAIFGVCLSIGNLIGSISDKIGRARLCNPAWLLCLVFFSLLFKMQDASTLLLPLVFIVGFGTCFGALCCVLNATIADVFHGKDYARIVGLITIGFASGGSVSPWLSGYLFDASGSHTYNYMVVMVALIASLIMFQFITPRRPRRLRLH